MIYSYGLSHVGSSHSAKGVVCQDANKIITLNNGYVIAAVADGVGSCKHSDIASSIAVDIATGYCAERIKDSAAEYELEKLIEEAYVEAQITIEKKSIDQNNPITDYDTTLSMVIYDGKHITYGHSGDGGIVGLTNKGDYIKVTTPQKNDGVYVIPLRAGKEKWVFGHVDEEIASVLLATDGVYDIFFPYLLKGQPVEIYVPLIKYFMDNNTMKYSCETQAKTSEERINFLKSDSCSSITDDITLVVLVNGDVTPDIKGPAFYAEPDWDALQLKWNKKAYPHLYKESSDKDNGK